MIDRRSEPLGASLWNDVSWEGDKREPAAGDEAARRPRHDVRPPERGSVRARGGRTAGRPGPGPPRSEPDGVRLGRALRAGRRGACLGHARGGGDLSVVPRQPGAVLGLPVLHPRLDHLGARSRALPASGGGLPRGVVLPPPEPMAHLGRRSAGDLGVHLAQHPRGEGSGVALHRDLGRGPGAAGRHRRPGMEPRGARDARPVDSGW